MAKARKTVEIELLRKWANSFLLHSGDDEVGQRRGNAGLLESALMEANCYKGFRYLEPDEMRNSLNGATAGVDYTGGKTVKLDDSRRHYF